MNIPESNCLCINDLPVYVLNSMVLQNTTTVYLLLMRINILCNIVFVFARSAASVKQKIVLTRAVF